MTPEALRNAYRVGTVVFAAADVPVEEFLERLPGISAMSERVVVTVSDADNVLEMAEKVMGGGARIGTETAEVELEAFALSEALTNLEIVDLSRGREHRGFDITGHHYWYRHPWASSDIVFLLRTDLPGHRRGLSPAGAERVWYLAPDYPERARSAVRRELKGQW
jgi:esterase/lipase superfamily enzyme